MATPSLATIPADIVRKLIRLNPPENWPQLRLISPIWNALVVEALNARPPISYVFMSFGLKKSMLVHLEIALPYADYFSTILSEVPGLEIVLLPKHHVFKFQFPWTDSDSMAVILTRIFASANKIETFHSASFDGNALHFVGKTMGNIRIERLETDFNLWNEHMRQATVDIIKRHKVHNIQMTAAKYVKEEICEALRLFSQYVAIIGLCDLNVKNDSVFGYKTHRFWHAFAKELIDTNDLKMIGLSSALRARGRSVFAAYRCDPFFEYMHQFVAYF